MTAPIHFRPIRAALAAALLSLPALAAVPQGMTTTWLDGEAALDAWLPSPTATLRARAGNRLVGGDRELEVLTPADGPALTAQMAWNPNQYVPFRVSWDGFGRLTWTFGGHVFVRDLASPFSSLAVRATSEHRGATVSVLQLQLNGVALGVGPRARSKDGSRDVEAVLVQGVDLTTGFVLRGLVRCSWIQPPPTGDGFRLDVLLGEPAELGHNFCVAIPNSTDAGCRLSWSGLPSISTDSLWLHADHGVPGAPCLFLTSSQVQGQPVGNGWLCLGAPVDRLAEFQTFDQGGRVSLKVPLSEGPLAGVVPGEVRNFQVWYRDPLGVPETSNLSDAVALLFVP